MKVYLLLDVVQTDGIKTAQPELRPGSTVLVIITFLWS